MTTGGRVPSISLTLSVLGVLLLIPFFSVSAGHWRDSSARVAGAQDVQESASRLDHLLRLSPAIYNELLSTGWEAGSKDLISQLPEAAAPFLNLNPSGSVEDQRAEVDALLSALGDPVLTEKIVQTRANVDDPAFEFGEMSLVYNDVIGTMNASIAEELIVLSSAASATGDVAITRLSRLAEAAADVQTSLTGMNGRWAQLESAAFVTPSLDDVQQFNHGLISFERCSRAFEASLPTSGALRDSWTDVAESEALDSLFLEYLRTSNRLSTDGLPVDPDSTLSLDLSSLDFTEAILLAGRVTAVVDLADEVDAGLDNVVNTSLLNLHSEAEAAVQRTTTERRATVAWLLVATILLLLAILLVVVLIVRPVKRMAFAARQLREGHLDVRVPERGPAELLVGARALNQALASLETTEAQAIALAEARLSDPILDQETPGALGASLQTAVRRLASSLSDREAIEKRLAYEATHDGLTKLSNRRAVLHHLDAAIARTSRSDTSVALLFIDLDDFKAVNDSHGHYSGDEVLRIVASRLTSTLREGDLAGRLGGDEFVVIAEPADDIHEALQLSERILQAVNTPIAIHGTTITPAASIGIGMASGQLTADELMRDADLAVYRAKAEGKGGIAVCDEALRDEVKARAELETAIRHGIDNDEFVLYFQPTVRADGHEITSVEALIRWQRPGHGLIPPDSFIPIAERSDLIVDIDAWVLDAVGSQLAAWAHNAETAHLEIAANISARHLCSGQLAERIQAITSKHEIQAGRLALEVTESALLDNIDMAAQELASLRDMGVRVALDDFGTGFMSLTHLRMLPVDVVKIDRSFVAELDSHESRSLIQLIVDTGHLLGFSVTAEGVETHEQSSELELMGADSLQGYFFSRPLPAEEIEKSLSRPLIA